MKRLIAFVLAVLMLALTLCSCDEETVLDTLDGIFGESEKEPKSHNEALEITQNIDFEPSVTGEVRMPSSLADFALELFDECADDDNTVISPYSVIYALALAQKGAAGNTLAEFEELFGVKKDTLEEFLSISLIAGGDKLKLSNSIWIENSYKEHVKEDYITSSKRDFAAEVFLSAFDNTTLREINDYISEKTEGLIKNALDRIDKDTVMFLINTVYFKANWDAPYYKSTEGDFTNIDGKKSRAFYMNSLESKFINDDKATGFIKDYAGGKYAFAAILPNENIELDDYVDSLTGKKLIDMLSTPSEISVSAKLPKFETKYNAELNEALIDMGLNEAFIDGVADFSNMVSSEEPIYIDRVIHNAAIKVDEMGTEAAASTIIDMNKYSGMIKEYVNLNRPFLYVIFDTETYLPVFMGQVTNM